MLRRRLVKNHSFARRPNLVNETRGFLLGNISRKRHSQFLRLVPSQLCFAHTPPPGRSSFLVVRRGRRGHHSVTFGMPIARWATFLLMCLPSHALIGTMLCDVPTPALVVDCTTARRQRGISILENISPFSPALQGLLFVHTSVTSGRDISFGAVGATTRGSTGYFMKGTREVVGDIVLASLDAPHCGGSAYVGLGLNNHFTGGYYWGRSSGPGAALPAPGVGVVFAESGLLQLVRTEDDENSNDGKRSEWCDFLQRGDQLQLVVKPEELATAGFDMLVGVCRDGDGNVPRGAEPRVEALWTRDRGSWVRTSA